MIVIKGLHIDCRTDTLTGILPLAHICAKFIAIYYIKIIHQSSQPHMVQWSSTTSDDAILMNVPGFKSGDSQLEIEVRHVLIVFFVRVPMWSLDLISYALFVDVLSSASRDHGGGSGFLGRVFFCFRQMRAF